MTVRRSDTHFHALEPLEPRALLTTSFEPAGTPILKTDDEVRSVLAADINNDHLDDLLISAGNQVLVRLGRGGGALAPARVAAQFNLNAGLLAVGDFDFDGHADIAAARVAGTHGLPGPAQTWVRILRGDGGGNFTPGPSILINERTQSLSAAQFDLDARDELLFNGWTLDIRGTGVNQRIVTTQAAPGLVVFSAAADLNGDGRDEIVASIATDSAWTGSYLRVYRNLGAQAFHQDANRVFNFYPQDRVDSVAVAAIGLPGVKHVVYTVTRETSGGGDFVVTDALTVVVSNGAVSLANNVRLDSREFTPDSPSGHVVGERRQWIVGVADVNDDGFTDVLVGHLEFAASPRGFTFEQRIDLTQILAVGNGDFDAFTGQVRLRSSLQPFGQSGVTPDVPPFYALMSTPVRPAPDLISAIRVDNPSGLDWRVERIRNTEAWKAPTASSFVLLRSDPAPGTPPPIGTPPTIYVGDKVSLFMLATTPELTRGASIASARFILDTNGNFQLDANDLVIAQAANDEPNRWGALSVQVTQTWLNAAVLGGIRLFAVGRDGTGVDSAAQILDLGISLP